MPGLAGFVPTGAGLERGVLQDMQSALIHHGRHRKGPLFSTPQVCATCVHTGIRKDGDAFHTESGLSVWLDGEFYNREEIARRLGVEADTDPALLLALFQTDPGSAAIPELDGIYAAAVFDSARGDLHLFTDRYGLRPLFWTRHRGALAWASEAKALLLLPGFTPVLDAQALEEFLGIGYILGDRTWFEGIERLLPATRLTYNVEAQALKTERYWWWDRISPQTGRLDERELAEELGQRFIRAVERRSPEGEQTGLILSGGLDSRAILAAMPDRKPPIPALTFGRKGSPDIQIAGRVAVLKGACHHTLDLSAENWLPPRIAGVWWTDGLLDLLHMHGIEHLDRMARLFDTCLNGAGGDGVVGGGHLFEPHEFPTYVRNKLNLSPDRCPTLFHALREEFSALGSAHAFYIHGRIRSFTLHGPRLGLFQGVDYRLPFLDYRFQDYLYSIPLSLKKNNRLYRLMLLNTFPDYYRKIPWQSTGAPISWPGWAVKTRTTFRKLRGKLQLRASQSPDYADYPAWLRLEPARSLFETLLLNPRALYPNHISRERVTRAWQVHLNGADQAWQLCRYLTLELHLQQVYEARWRKGPE